VAAVFYDAAKRVIAGAFATAMDEAMREGLLRPVEPAEPAAHLMGMIEHATLWRRLLVNEPGEQGSDAVAASAVAVILGAYAPGA
jgi:hypothetical protein